ncbi:MAG TPA: glycosyltransferase family 4 protein [Planctomycetota bacterium]
MRVALVHMRHGPVGGTERILDALARHLVERGHAVTIVCRSHGASHPALRFQVLRRAVPGSAWRMWAFAQDVERHVRAGDYELVFALGKTWTHDVIRTSGGSHATYVERMRAAGGGGWRDWALLRAPKDRLALAIERRAYAPGAYRRVIANSRLVRDDMVRRHAIPTGSIEVVPNGVDVARFRPRPAEEVGAWRRSLGLEERDFVFLFLGKGFVRKGLARTLSAFAEVARARPESRLVVVGRDSGQARFEAEARALGLEGRVRFLGERRDPELCLAAADVHVLPTWYDSFAFTVLEALACGKPVITTDGAGASEWVEPEVHGTVLPAACTAGELAQALGAWAEPGRARAAGAAARARAEELTFERTLGQLADVLERVAAERPVAAPVADA